MSPSESRPFSDIPPAASAEALPTCPSCGQHIDAANIRCPRCRQWLREPRGGRVWGPVATAVALLMLALSGVFIEMAVHAIWSPRERDASVPMRDPIADTETRALREP